MAKFQASILVLFSLSLLVKTMVEGCSLQTIGGGCPNEEACLQTCLPCYRGIGIVSAACFGPGGGTPFWICNCEFKNGAPCPPQGPPACPKPPAIAHLNRRGRGYAGTRVNGTLVIGDVN